MQGLSMSMDEIKALVGEKEIENRALRRDLGTSQAAVVQLQEMLAQVEAVSGVKYDPALVPVEDPKPET